MLFASFTVSSRHLPNQQNCIFSQFSHYAILRHGILVQWLQNIICNSMLATVTNSINRIFHLSSFCRNLHFAVIFWRINQRVKYSQKWFFISKSIKIIPRKLNKKCEFILFQKIAGKDEIFFWRMERKYQVCLKNVLSQSGK